MQQLKIEHKKITTTDQKVVENTIEKDRREGKGRVLALSRNVFRLQNKSSHNYYVESESRDDHYYFVKFKPEVFEYWCSCKDNSTRGLKCKHLWGIEFAIKWGTIKDIDKIPSLSTTTTSINIELGQTNLQPCKLGQTNIQDRILGEVNNNNEALHKPTKSYKDDGYDF
jgi:predicted nucleic acid-binding Zn finger protein